MIFLFKTIFLLSLLYLSCTFYSSDNDPLIMTRIGTIADTVSIWPTLTFLFSVPLEDSSITLKILPDPGPVYDTRLSSTKDTLQWTVTGSLDGNTSYQITLHQFLTAENGSKLYPGDAVFTIVTFPRECEPNNCLDNADSLSTVCFGIIAPAHDTDYFYINGTSVSSLYLTSHDNKAGWLIKDGENTVIVSDDGFDITKTAAIPDSIPPPLLAGIFSLFGTDTRYEIGIIP